MFSSPRPPLLPTLFLFLLPVSWGGGRAWVPLCHSFGTLPCSVRSVLSSRCLQSGAAFFPVALSGLVVLIIFSYYMWFWEETSVSPLTPPSLILSLFIYIYILLTLLHDVKLFFPTNVTFSTLSAWISDYFPL